MAADDSSGPRAPGPIVLRIKLRYDDVEVMVQRFAANVGKSGLFLPTRSLQPIGSEIKFELRLSDDTPVLVGLGRVKAAKPPDPQHARAAFGMAVELMRVTPQSRALILRMLERRRETGLPELGLPTAADIDAARRAEAIEAGREPSGPVAVVAPPPAPIEPGEALLTAPRRTTGPMAVAKLAAIAPLAPEPARKRRMAISEIIDSASGPIASVSAAVPGLEDDVDVGAALARARALAGGALDAELEALCEVAAAPVEVSIEAASAELARQLGGHAVRRDRSGGWTPPPVAVVATADASYAGSDPAAEPASAGPPLAEGSRADLPPAGPQVEAPPGVEASLASEAEAPTAQPALDSGPAPLPPLEPAPADAIRTEPSEHLAFPAPDIAALAADAEEQTEMGDIPAPGDGFEPPLHLGVDELDDFEILAEADADDEDLLASHGEHDASQRRSRPGRPVTAERRPSELDFAARLDLGDDSDRYLSIPSDEFSAHHVIDGLHDDLTGERTGAGQPVEWGDDRRPDPHAISAGAALAAFDDEDDDELIASRRGVQPIFEPEASSSFTLAAMPSEALDLDAPLPSRGEVGEPAGRARRPSGPHRPEPAVLRGPPRSLHEAPVEDYELEHALEALDVDLDDLSIPHAATELQRDRSYPTVAVRPAAVIRTPAAQSRGPAAQSRGPAPQGRVPDTQPLTPQTRGPAPQTQPLRPQNRTPVPQTQPLAPQSRAPAPTPSRAVRPTGHSTPSSGRGVVPHATSESVDIDLDDDDD